MTTHAMIDLETLATGFDATVLTLGGLKFNPNNMSDPHSEIYFKLDVDEQTERGRRVDDSTIEWWATQPKEVQEDAFGESDRTPVYDVLRALSKWCVGVDTIWCQGPAFDIVILEHMYKQWDHHIPWPFWLIKDSRTLFGIMPQDPRKKIEFKAHNALEDCRIQALCVQQCIKELGLIVK
jgi:exodeoxyribonuclease VIII